MCEPAVFTWGASYLECLGVVRIMDLTGPYGCDIVNHKVQTARGNLYGFEAEVSCVPYVVFEEFNESQNKTFRAFNTSEPIQGTFGVPTLSSETDGYGPGELKNQTLWLTETVCFTQAEDELVQNLHLNSSVDPLFLGNDPSEEYCPEYQSVDGVVQPLECCIAKFDVVLDWNTKTSASVAAILSGCLLALYLFFRCCTQCCLSRCCCCIKKCKCTKQDDGGETKLCTRKNIGMTLFRCGAVSLSLAGFGFNAIVTARYFTTRTIVMGVVYEAFVGFLEGLSAFWIGDGLPLNDTGRDPPPLDDTTSRDPPQVRRTTKTQTRRKIGVLLSTLMLAAYLTSVSIDIETRQTCGFSNTQVMYAVGVGMYLVLGVVASWFGKSVGYAQQLFTDILAQWPAFITTISCEPWIRLGIIVLATVLGWVGTALVSVYGDTVASVT